MPRFQPSPSSHYGDSRDDAYSAQVGLDWYDEGAHYGDSSAGDVAGLVGGVFSTIFTGISQSNMQKRQLAHEKKMTKKQEKLYTAQAKLAEAQAAAASAQSGLAWGGSSKYLYIGGALTLSALVVMGGIILLKKEK